MRGRPVSTAEVAAARERMPGAFGPPPAVRLGRTVVAIGFAGLFGYCLWALGFGPARICEGLLRLVGVLRFMFPPAFWTERQPWAEALQALGETVAMAFLGTLIGAAVAFLLALLGARNVTRWTLSRFVARRGFDAVRSLEQVVLALIFVRAFGLGPLPGIMAIAAMEVGLLAKLFAEALENATPGPADGIRAAGGSGAQVVRYGLLPQVAPVMLSTVLYEFESNTRSSTILGVVGAGGIGGLIFDRIGANAWPDVWTLIFLVMASVYLIDRLSTRLRHSIGDGWDEASRAR